jgi:hypothetical protein
MMNPFHYIRGLINSLKSMQENVARIEPTLHKIQEALGRVEGRQVQLSGSNNLKDNEYRVFSQWGEDGIIQFLLRHIKIAHKIFVEFGVQNYTESNTRFLLVNNNWAGLVIDGSGDNIAYIRKDPIYWRYNLKAVHSFITKANINNIILENGIKGDIGLLSIDIDGNDYWVWESITVINPSIVIVEYNHRFGKEQAVTIPYDENFVREKAHYSAIYYGASLKALCLLAKRKGYAFIGCNTAGNNAFFLRKDLIPYGLREITTEDGFVSGKFRESRDRDGNLLFLSLEEEAQLITTLPLVVVE